MDDKLSIWKTRFFWKLSAFLFCVIGVPAVLLASQQTLPGSSFAMAAAWIVVSSFAASWWLTRRICQPFQTTHRFADWLHLKLERKSDARLWDDEWDGWLESLDRIAKFAQRQVNDLEQSSRQWETVFSSMDEGVLVLGANRDLLLANPAARRLLHLSESRSEELTFGTGFSASTLRQSALDVLRSGTPRHFTIEQEGNPPRILGVSATPLPGEPSSGVVMVFQDVTELRRLESLRQDFVANVSHELKTPLSSIKAYAETLSQGAINDQEINQRFVTRIEEQADRLHQLILDLLRLARIESGDQMFEIAPVELAGVVLKCLSEHQDAADAKAIELVCESCESPEAVRADEEGLRQILDNLIDNAIKYTGDGGRVVVRWSRGETGNVELDVQDNGIGIAEDNQARLFERFYRVDRARSRELGGTGLGLSIVKHLTQSFGGTVGVSSREGEGTTFQVKLPTAETPATVQP